MTTTKTWKLIDLYAVSYQSALQASFILSYEEGCIMTGVEVGFGLNREIKSRNPITKVFESDNHLFIEAMNEFYVFVPSEVINLETDTKYKAMIISELRAGQFNKVIKYQTADPEYEIEIEYRRPKFRVYNKVRLLHRSDPEYTFDVLSQKEIMKLFEMIESGDIRSLDKVTAAFDYVYDHRSHKSYGEYHQIIDYDPSGNYLQKLVCTTSKQHQHLFGKSFLLDPLRDGERLYGTEPGFGCSEVISSSGINSVAKVSRYITVETCRNIFVFKQERLFDLEFYNKYRMMAVKRRIGKSTRMIYPTSNPEYNIVVDMDSNKTWIYINDKKAYRFDSIDVFETMELFNIIKEYGDISDHDIEGQFRDVYDYSIEAFIC